MNDQRQKFLEAYESRKLDNIEVLLDNLSDVRNIGAICRSANGFGISNINLFYSKNKFPHAPKLLLKTSSGASKWSNFNFIKSLELFVNQKKSEGFKFIGTLVDKDAQSLVDFSFPEKVILVVGSESQGMSEEVKKVCDEFIYIPMIGIVESFNVSVAAGICLFEIVKGLKS